MNMNDLSLKLRVPVKKSASSPADDPYRAQRFGLALYHSVKLAIVANYRFWQAAKGLCFIVSCWYFQHVSMFHFNKRKYGFENKN